MQTSGYSPYQILGAVMKAAFIIVVLTFFIGEILAPYTEYKATQGRALAKTAGEAVLTAEGIWLRQNHHFIYIHQVLDRNTLADITDYVFNDQDQMVLTLQAPLAIKTKTGWMLKNTKTSVIQTDKIMIKQSSMMPWDVTFDPKLLAASENDPRNMSLIHLWHYIEYLQNNALDASTYLFSFWKRAFQPLATLVMIFLAIPFIFGPLRTVTMGVRIVSGIAIGFGFYILNQIMPSVITLYQWPAIIGVLLPIVIFTLIGFILLRRVRG